ncbi:DeoR/GlpR family DNA-binding transcription regulator [Clostridium lacusfryxellense]|uniref:DeoR/GlpR family DNA-binding transcription regulator n=1 Tax=Clostridium lacusfryxellense TaxID=205328 RepID=UPI001C0E54E4|nr:DeoR/GlpR family DNA-binding transcription regulator [Clostridium lacusfryxellense]MBU3114631.1 DeoR/GlpR family DNA-binding transcription regulator [Clostridium lacusfryxellense]
MYQEERLKKILEYLNCSNNLSVHEICKMFDISRDTARRDIVKLVEEGTVMRTHGGITLPGLINTIRDYRQRLEAHSEEKRKISEKALMYIKDNEHYFFDVSTTVSYLAKELNKNVTVFTHSLDNIEILSENKAVTVHCIGGCLNKENRFFFDIDCKSSLNGIHFDAAFIGAAAITEDGIYYANHEDAFIKQISAKQSDKVILLADFEKYGKTAYYKGLDWDQIDVIITDCVPPSLYVDIIKSNNIELIIIE